MLWIVAGLLLATGQALPNRTFCDDIWKAAPPVVEDLRAGRQIAIMVAEGLPAYHFHVAADPDCGGITKIEVRTAAGLLLQLLTVEGSEAPFAGSKFLAAEDLNFDGFLDLMCLTSWGGTGNNSYRIWLFNPKSHLFELSADLSKLSNPSANVKTHEITASSNLGMAGNVYSRATYQWREGRLVIHSSEQQDWDPKVRCFVRMSETYDRPRPKKTRKVVCDPDWK